jgi:WD40 repeat protein
MQKTVIKPSLPKPGRVAVSTARFSSEGRLIVAGLNNGTIQVWDVKGELHA